MGKITGAGVRVFRKSLGSPAAPANDTVLAAYTDDGAAAVFAAGDLDAQPDVPRNVTATADGTTADIGAIQVVVTGTNSEGDAITETLPAFTVNTAGTVVGSKAFATITQVDIPAHDGTGATTAIGLGDKLGLGVRLDTDTVLNAFFGGVRESTRPTVAVSASATESNTVDLNSASDGSAVLIDYYDTE